MFLKFDVLLKKKYLSVHLYYCNYAKKIVGLSDKFSFKIPKEGGFLSIENLAVSVKTKNMLLNKKSISEISEKTGYSETYLLKNKYKFLR